MSEARPNFNQFRTQRKQKGAHLSVSEIEKILKKAVEGCNLFENWWKAIMQKPNPYQKNKLEGLMRAEIKKLIRFRESMKTWITWDFLKNNDAVYRAITDIKKQVETLMLQWKTYERESKRKTYSKEALYYPQGVDPFQKECNDLHDWFVRSIDNLGVQIDMFESELEALTTIKKKKLVKYQLKRMESLKYFIGRHKFHIRQLEKLLRTLDNLTYDDDNESGNVHEEEDVHEFVRKVGEIKKEVDYYLESNMDVDFQDNFYIYEGLASICYKDYKSNSTEFPSAEDKAAKYSLSVSDLEAAFPESNSGQSSTKQRHCSSNSLVDALELANFFSPPPENEITSDQAGQNSSNTLISKQPNENGYRNGYSRDDEYSENVADLNDFEDYNGEFSCHGLKKSAFGSATSKCSTESTEINSKNEFERFENRTPANGHGFSGKRQSRVPGEDWDVNENKAYPIDLTVDSTASGSASGGEYLSLSSTSSSVGTEIIPRIRCLQATLSSAESHEPEYFSPPPPTINIGTSRSFADTVKKSQKEFDAELRKADSNGTHEGFVPPLLGAAPLGRFPLRFQELEQCAILEAAFHHMLRENSERRKPVLPPFPCETPSYYPQAPLNVISLMDFYTRLDIETLFFIFYYGEDCKGHLQASRELKERGWRYHKKFRTWFLRLGDPILVTWDFEQGTFIYFDVENWRLTKKEGFMLELIHLQDPNSTTSSI